MDNNTEMNNNAETVEEVKEAEDTAKKPEEKKTSFLSDVIEIMESTLIMVFVIVLVVTYLLHPVNIIGLSMYPTLNKHYDASDPNSISDRIFMTTVYGDIKYGDILVIDKKENYLLDDSGNVYVPDDYQSFNECIIKRVIAVGGQTVDIHDDKVYVDGQLIDEPYIAAGSTTYDTGAFDGQYPITIPEGYYFVMGDNRNHSADSRNPGVGLIKEDQIYGKALARYYPIKEFHILTDSWKESAND